VDPTGHELVLAGDQDERDRVVSVLNQGLEGSGYEVEMDDNGKLSLVTNDADASLTEAQQAMVGYLTEIIDHEERVTINVVSGSSDVIIDSWALDTVDIEDVEAFGSCSEPGASAQSMLFHALVEQYAKQALGISDYHMAHFDYAIPAEGAVAGATVGDDIYFYNKHHSDGVYLYYGFTYIYPNGNVIRTFNSLRVEDGANYQVYSDIYMNRTRQYFNQ
jgi:hypothetical protein